MDKYSKTMEDLLYRMISFTEECISSETNPVNKGKKILMKTIFLNEFRDIIYKKKEIERQRRENINDNVEVEYINIDIPESDSDDINLTDEEDIVKKEPPMQKVHEPQTEQADRKDKKVKFEKIQKGGSKKAVTRKNETKKQKINRKLNMLGAGMVKEVGKKFDIKPEEGQRYLTKGVV